ncbi:MAG: hypothetical protein M0R40_10305 [Firmicutes bacterium]|nr:hypothetical protein [Bacillota bacterium]
MINWTDVVIAGIGIVFTGAIIPLVKAGIQWLRSKSNSEAIRSALDEAERIAEKTVLNLQQTMVDGLKDAGEFTSEKAKEVMELAFQNFINDISQETFKTLTNNVESIEQYVRSLIEARLYAMKSQKLL